MKKLAIQIVLCVFTGILSAQNVGIGTLYPLNLLHVYSPDGDVNLARFQSPGGYGQIQVTNTSVISDLGATAYGLKGYVGTNSGHDFTIRTGANDRMLFDFETGNIGINTDNPSKPLTIQQDGSNGFLQFRGNGGSNTWHWWGPNGDGFALAETGVNDHRFTLKPGGNVGIGVSNPLFKLQVHGDSQYGDLAWFENDGPVGYVYAGTAARKVFLGADENRCLVGTFSDNLLFMTGGYEIMTLRGVGKRVGIGTLDPGTRLEVLSSEFDVAKFRTQLNDANIKVESVHGTTALGYTPDGGYVGTSSAGNFSIKVQNSTRMFFKNSTGYIGINTLGPTEALDVNGNVKANGFKMTTGASNGYILTSDFSGNASWTAPPVIPNHWTISGNNLCNANTGFVGIGTSTPTKPLTIKGDTNQDLLQFKNKDDVAKWHWWMPGGTDLVLTESNVEDYRITVKPGGNVGIGKQNPTQRLDVQGNINLSGKIMSPAPVTLSLQAGWEVYDPDFGAPSYYQDKQGIVLLSGLAEYPGGTTGGHVCTLPGGYRPIKHMYFNAASDDPDGYCRVLIDAITGQISVFSGGDIFTWVSFDNIVFKVN